ncbi:MAG: formate--phosphoribosylaminoimidazolecarboxamide ligase family protein [Candidatus Thermoplasmatota archaeon]|nr:formate--phosphoribosylaminoimidazolecarboxamide ligase family protein [Candidatus Thermoplasmatota archaeon]
MIQRDAILEVLEGYDSEKVKVGVLASHSALDVCDGAVEEGFRTITLCQAGREEPYVRYFKAVRDETGRLLKGVVDEAIVLKSFKEAITQEVQDTLRRKNVLFVPNRSFVSYVGLEEVEDSFLLPLVGSRNLLRSEERTEERGYYWILEKAGLPFPRLFKTPEEIDSLAIVKLPHKVKRLERGFFTAASQEEYEEKSEKLLDQGVITREDLDVARVERYILGPVFNFDFFYSPMEESGERLELLGIDWRFETSLDGHVRLPAEQQLTLMEEERYPEYVVCGHNSATLRESLLSKVFPLAEAYVKATQEHFPPGVIGPFTLQTCVDKDMDFYIYDVSPRIGGGTNVHMSLGHPYGNTLWRSRMSTGRRVALEIRRALERGQLDRIVT